MASEWRPVTKEEPMNWPRIIFDQIAKVNNADGMTYEMEVEKLRDNLYPYWIDDENWQKIIDEIEAKFRNITKELHNPPSTTDLQRIGSAKTERSRSIFRALILLIHNSTGLLPHKEVEGVIDEYRPDEATLQAIKRSDSESVA